VKNATGTYDNTHVHDDAGNVVGQVNADGTKYFMHSDHEGSTGVVTNSSGGVVENTLYSPHGEILSGGTVSRFDSEGKEFDSVVGDTDFHFRKMNPSWGLFLQPDTLISNVYDPQSLNRYMFERGNSYGKVDPTGHCIWDACVAEATFVLALLAIAGATYSGYHLAGEIDDLAEQQGGLTGVDYAITAGRIATIASGGLFYGLSKAVSALGFAGRQGVGFLGASYFESKTTKIHHQNAINHLQQNNAIDSSMKNSIAQSITNTANSGNNVNWYYNSNTGVYTYRVGDNVPSNPDYQLITKGSTSSGSSSGSSSSSSSSSSSGGGTITLGGKKYRCTNC